MSNFIPMVSSSPPPLDDGGGFNDWGDDDDDFGNFTSATDVANDFQPFTGGYNDTGQWDSIQESEPCQNQFEKFADFGKFSVSTEEDLKDNGTKLNNKDRARTKPDLQASSKPCQEESKSPGLELDLQKAHIQSGDGTNSNHNSYATNCREYDDALVRDQSVQNGKKFGKSHSENNIDSISSMSAGDSGLCSTDISPVPRSDEIYDPCDKSQGSDLDDFADFNSDSSTGKEVSFHQEEANENVIQNSNICDTEEMDREHAIITPTKLELGMTDDCVSNVCINGKPHELSTTDMALNKDDCITPSSDVLSDISTDSNPTENVEVKTKLNLSSQGNELSPVQLELREVEETDTDLHSKEKNDCDNTNLYFEQRVEENFCNDEMSDSSGNSVNRTVSENLQSENFKQESCSDSSVLSTANNLETADGVQDRDTSHRDKSVQEKQNSCKDSDDESNCSLKMEEENKTGHKVDIVESLNDQCTDNCKETSQDHDVGTTSSRAKFSDNDCDSNNSCDDPCEQNLPTKTSDDSNEDFTDFVTTPTDLNTGVDQVEDKCVSDVQINETFQKSNQPTDHNCENEQAEIDDDFADFQETAFENNSDMEQHYSENADLDLPSCKNYSTPTDNQSEDLDLSKDSGKIDNCGDDSKTEDDLEEEFDDFADFQTHPNEVDAKIVEDSNSDDSFGAFNSENERTSDSKFAAFQSTDTSNKDEGWADFASEPSAPHEDIVSNADEDDYDDDDDDFNEFGNFSGSTVMAVTEKPVTEKRSLTARLGDCFPALNVLSDLTGEDIPSVLELPAFCNLQERKSSPDLWTNLQKNDVSTKLGRLWSDSRSNNKLFQSLRIDTRNILLGHRKPSVPVYASNLTLLEPTKGPAPSDSKTENKLVDTNKTEETPSSQYRKSRSNTRKTKSKPSDLPPVQFDWTNSGLTNPLEANDKTLELDFLVVKESESVTRNGVFDSELMHGRDPAKAGMQPLENILAKLKTNTTMKRTRQTENLSREANKVLTSLPGLSFMQAKVLMFPFRQDSD